MPRRGGVATSGHRAWRAALDSVLVIVFYILHGLLQLLIIFIIVAAVWSWLVAFNVVNTRNRLVYQVQNFLMAVTRPVLWPLQKVIPPIGGVDITPIIAILILQALQVGLTRLEFSMLTPAPY